MYELKKTFKGGYDMKINVYLIYLSSSIILIFGGLFTIRYFTRGELLLDQLIASLIGIVILIGSLVWRKINTDTKN